MQTTNSSWSMLEHQADTATGVCSRHQSLVGNWGMKPWTFPSFPGSQTAPKLPRTFMWVTKPFNYDQTSCGHFQGRACCHATVFNYRLSRARRIAENAFGILTARWRILLRRVDLLPRHAEFVVLACCTLHNFLCAAREATYNPPGYADYNDEHGNRVPGQWRHDAQNSALFELEPTSAKNFSKGAFNARSIFTEYFMKEGTVPWQWAHTGVQAPRFGT